MAVREISGNPPSNAVTRPTVPEKRDEDIDSKLRLYAIFLALGNGKLPSNEQINVALSSAVESNMLNNPSEKLSPEGRVLVKDLRDVIEAGQHLFLKKNYHEEFQNFLFHSMETQISVDVDVPVNKDRAKDQGDHALQGLRTLGRLLITNGQFRKLLEDFALLARDMAADVASKATERIRPDEERLAKIDEPAPESTWHEDPPSFNEMRSTLRSQFSPKKESTDEGRHSGTDPTSAKTQVTNYLQTKIGKERREKTIYRLKRMVVEIQQHQDYMKAIDALIALAEEYARHTKRVTGDTNRQFKSLADDEHIQKEYLELKTLLENFADSTSMDDIFDAIDDVIADANNDREFSEWFKNVDHFIRKCLREDGYILKDESTEEWKKLSDEGRYFVNERYKDHTDRLTYEINNWLEYMTNDPDCATFGEKIQKLFHDLGQDEKGKYKFKPHLLKDVTNVIVPGVFQYLGYIPIPRIEVHDPALDAIIENVVIESENLMPNIFEIHANTFYRFKRAGIEPKSEQHFSMHASQIQCDLKDVAYYIHRKSGFPSFRDTGVLDLLIGGQGLSFTLKFSAAKEPDRDRYFNVDSVRVNIDNLRIILKKSNHKTLLSFFRPLLLRIFKPVITKAAEAQIRKSFDQVDEQIWVTQNEYNKSKEAASHQPSEDRPNAVSMYMEAIQKRVIELKKTGTKDSDSKVNLTGTTFNSVFPDIHLPGTITSKAIKYREMAYEGNEWRSPIFDFGNARPKQIPEPKQITRKSRYQKPVGVDRGSSGAESAGGSIPGADRPQGEYLDAYQ